MQFGQESARHDLDFAVDAVDDVERALEHLALVLGDRTILAFGEHDARERADRFLDHVAARRDHRPRGVGERLAARRLTLDVSDSAKSWLADRGYDPAYGARPLRRLVQREIGDQLARALLAGEITEGDTVVVDRAEGENGLTVTRKG